MRVGKRDERKDGRGRSECREVKEKGMKEGKGEDTTKGKGKTNEKEQRRWGEESALPNIMRRDTTKGRRGGVEERMNEGSAWWRDNREEGRKR